MDISFLSPKEQTAIRLYEVGAVLDKGKSPGGNGFKLKIHEKYPHLPLSPLYIDLRTSDNPKQGPLTPELVFAIGQQFYHLAHGLKMKYDYVVGVPRAGEPLAEAFLSSMVFPSVTIVKLNKEEVDGRRKITRKLNGNTYPPGIVLLVDDLVTFAESKIEAIIALRQMGLVVRDIIVFLDREQGGANELKSQGFKLHPIFTMTQLLDFYLKMGLINKETRDEAIAYKL